MDIIQYLFVLVDLNLIKLFKSLKNKTPENKNIINDIYWVQ